MTKKLYPDLFQNTGIYSHWIFLHRSLQLKFKQYPSRDMFIGEPYHLFLPCQLPTWTEIESFVSGFKESLWGFEASSFNKFIWWFRKDYSYKITGLTRICSYIPNSISLWLLTTWIRTWRSCPHSTKIQYSSPSSWSRKWRSERPNLFFLFLFLFPNRWKRLRTSLPCQGLGALHLHWLFSVGLLALIL